MSVEIRAAVLAAAVAVSASIAHAAIIVDTFDQTSAAPLTVTTNIGPAGTTITEAPSDVPASQRNTTIKNTNMDIAGLDGITSQVFTNVNNSLFNYSSTAGAQGTVELRYGTNPGALAHLNLSQATSIQISFLAFDNANNGNMTISSSLANSTTSQALANVLVTTPGAQTINIPISGIPSAILSDTDVLTFDFIAPKAADFRIDAISITVPEPAPFALLAVAAGVAFLQRRPRRQPAYCRI